MKHFRNLLLDYDSDKQDNNIEIHPPLKDLPVAAVGLKDIFEIAQNN